MVAMAMGGDFSTQNPKVENPVKTTCPILFCFGVGERERFRRDSRVSCEGKKRARAGTFLRRGQM